MKVRRILVALDASPASLRAAEAAAELAAALGAELVGLFVEDVRLIRLADLPPARQAGRMSATLRRLESGEVELQLRVQAARARAALERIAGRERIRHRFQVARGTVADEILQAAGQADLLALGRGGWSLRPTLGSTVRAVLAARRGRVLLLGEGARLGSPVLVLYDGGEPAQAALALAATVARRVEGEVRVLVASDDEARGGELSEEASRRLEEHGAAGEVRWLASTELADIVQAIRRLGARTVVLAPGVLGLDAAGLAELLEEIEHPVVAVH